MIVDMCEEIPWEAAGGGSKTVGGYGHGQVHGFAEFR